MADQKNKDEWDELDEKEVGAPGISPEIARALLATNPALRDGGMNTDLLLRQHKNAQEGKAPTAQQKTPAPKESIVDTAKQLEKRLAEAKQRHDKEVAEAAQRFNAEKKAMHEAFTQWLVQHDPELRSPFTQQLLEQKKAFLASIGFDVKAYVNARMLKK